MSDTGIQNKEWIISQTFSVWIYPSFLLALSCETVRYSNTEIWACLSFCSCWDSREQENRLNSCDWFSEWDKEPLHPAQSGDAVVTKTVGYVWIRAKRVPVRDLHCLPAISKQAVKYVFGCVFLAVLEKTEMVPKLIENDQLYSTKLPRSQSYFLVCGKRML